MIKKPKRIFIDCTFTYTTGLNTGIQRVVKNIIFRLNIASQKYGVQCLPIVLKDVEYPDISKKPIGLLHLGSDISDQYNINSVSDKLKSIFQDSEVFLMVGTLEVARLIGESDTLLWWAIDHYVSKMIGINGS